MRNGVVAGSIPSKPDFTETRKFYFGDFDFKNDIIELRHNGGNDGTTIHVDLIDQGVSTRLLFGSNADIDWIRLDSDFSDPQFQYDGWFCTATREGAYAIKIQNGIIIESECIKPESSGPISTI